MILLQIILRGVELADTAVAAAVAAAAVDDDDDDAELATLNW